MHIHILLGSHIRRCRITQIPRSQTGVLLFSGENFVHFARFRRFPGFFPKNYEKIGSGDRSLRSSSEVLPSFRPRSQIGFFVGQSRHTNFIGPNHGISAKNHGFRADFGIFIGKIWDLGCGLSDVVYLHPLTFACSKRVEYSRLSVMSENLQPKKKKKRTVRIITSQLNAGIFQLISTCILPLLQVGQL